MNRDRHGANIEVYPNGLFVPLFDHGLSFVAPYFNDIEAIKNFNFSRNYRVNNYIGFQYLRDNLFSIPVNAMKVPVLDFMEFYKFLKTMPLPGAHKDKIWEIITLRYRNARGILC
jgi:hypothetical protein